MTHWIAFTVLCAGCGFKNYPSQSVHRGVKMVLDGTFRSCKECKKEFRLIRVPLRPLVIEELRFFTRDEMLKMTERLRFFKYENRRTPGATGYPR